MLSIIFAHPDGRLNPPFPSGFGGFLPLTTLSSSEEAADWAATGSFFIFFLSLPSAAAEGREGAGVAEDEDGTCSEDGGAALRLNKESLV